MNTILRLIASVIVLVSMYLSSVWVSKIADNTTSAIVLILFVLALEAAKAMFIILVGQYHVQHKYARSTMYGVMALILMSLSFCSSLSNLTQWKSANTTPTYTIKLLDESIQQVNEGIAAANTSISKGYIKAATPILEGLMSKRASLVKERETMAHSSSEAESMNTYMLVTLSVSVEIVSFLCLLAVGHAQADSKTVKLIKKTQVKTPICVGAVDKVVAEAKKCVTSEVSVPSIRKIKSEFKCGYAKAKHIQDTYLLEHTV